MDKKCHWLRISAFHAVSRIQRKQFFKLHSKKRKVGKTKMKIHNNKKPQPTKKPHPNRESREEPRLFFASTHLLVDVLHDQKWKTFNLVFIINIWANCYFLFFKRSLSEKCSNPLLWQLQNGGLTASLDGKHRKKKILTNLRWISTQYDIGFFFCDWGQGFFKSESYVKPSARTPTQG